MQPSTRGIDGSGDRLPPPLSPVATPTSAEASLSPFSTSSDSTRTGSNDMEGYRTTPRSPSPWSSPPLSSSRRRRSITQTPPPIPDAPPTIIIGYKPSQGRRHSGARSISDAAPPANSQAQVPRSRMADIRRGGKDTVAPPPPQPPVASQAPSGFSFKSSFFSFTSGTSPSSSSTSTSSESASPPTQPANSSGVHHAPQSSTDEDTADEASLLSSTPSSLGVRGTATSESAITMSATSQPPPAPAAVEGSMATQVLVPPQGYGIRHPRGSRASLSSAASSTASSRPLLSESADEGYTSTDVTLHGGVPTEEEERVLTLPVEALEEIADSPTSTPLRLPSRHSPPPTASSPLSALAAALTTTYGCPALSQLATTLLCVDGASVTTPFHVAHASTCVTTAALSWTAQPLPFGRNAVQRQPFFPTQPLATLPTPTPPPGPEAAPDAGEKGGVPVLAAVAESGAVAAKTPAVPPVTSGKRRARQRRQPAVAVPAVVPEVAAHPREALARAQATDAQPQRAAQRRGARGVPLPVSAGKSAPPAIPPLSPTDSVDDVPLYSLMEKLLMPAAQRAAPQLDDVPLSTLFSTDSGLNGSTSASAASSATAVLPLRTPALEEGATSQRGSRKRGRASGASSAAASTSGSPASAPTATDSAAAAEAAGEQPPGARHGRASHRKPPSGKASATDSVPPTAAAADLHDATKPKRKTTSPSRSRKKTETVAEGLSLSEVPALRLWWGSVCTSVAAAPLAGRPCLWIELAPGYQEAHGALLRQVLVCWSRLTQNCNDEEGAVAPLSFAASRPGSKKGAKARRRRRSLAATANGGAVLQEGGSGAPPLLRAAAAVGLVVLLCPVTVPVQEALRWWTTRAHVEHGFVPPLLAVSLSSSSQGASPQLLLHAAATHAAGLFGTNASCSLAVSCTAEGYAALSRLLPLTQVFDNLRSCASALGGAVGLPVAAPTASGVDEDGCGVGDLAAVLAAASWDTPTATTSLQAHSFASLCRWNGLAAALQRRPRRPQLLLQHTTLDLTTSQEPVQKKDETSVVPAALRPARVTVGLVRPATRHEDTFACSAQREARVLAARPPPVTLLPSHALAITAFARAFFGLDTYATSVNVLVAQARLSSRGISDYLSGYSCVTTGPLRYTVSATLRCYLQVRMAVSLAPLLSCVQSATANRALVPASHLSDPGTGATAAASHDGEAAPLATVLTRLAHVQWRTVLPELSCTCNPRLYEQVPRTEDGTKTCRHLAQLFHYFTTQLFRVMGPLNEAGVDRGALLRPSSMHMAAPPPPPPPLPKGSDLDMERPPVPKQQQQQQPEKEEEGGADADLLVNTVPLAFLYSHPSSLGQDSGGGGDTSGVDGATAPREEQRASDVTGTAEATVTPAVVHAPRKRRRPAEVRAAAAALPPPPQPLPSSSPPADVRVAGSPNAAATTDFHNEAVQYALRLLSQRLQGSRSGGGDQSGSSGSGGGSLPVPAAESPGTGAKRVRQSRMRGSAVSAMDEQARALQLVEQLLRAQLSPR